MNVLPEHNALALADAATRHLDRAERQRFYDEADRLIAAVDAARHCQINMRDVVAGALLTSYHSGYYDGNARGLERHEERRVSCLHRAAGDLERAAKLLRESARKGGGQ